MLEVSDGFTNLMKFKRRSLERVDSRHSDDRLFRRRMSCRRWVREGYHTGLPVFGSSLTNVRSAIPAM